MSKMIFHLILLLFGNASAALYSLGEYGSNSQIVIRINDPDRIREANSILAGERGDVVRWKITGIVIKETACYNPRWSFHLDPDRIDFGEYFTEVCDATIDFLEDHIDEAGGAFLPNSRWCPWSSYLLNEEPEDDC